MSKKSREKRELEAAKKKKNDGRPNNLLIAVLIFGTVALMFAFIWGYKYFHLSKNIQTYMKEAGYDTVFENMQIDDSTVMSVTAKKNKLSIVTTVTTDDHEAAKKKYSSEEGKDSVKYMASYYLYTLKSNCRGLTASATYTVKVNDEQVLKDTISFRQATSFLKENGLVE